MKLVVPMKNIIYISAAHFEKYQLIINELGPKLNAFINKTKI